MGEDAGISGFGERRHRTQEVTDRPVVGRFFQDGRNQGIPIPRLPRRELF